MQKRHILWQCGDLKWSYPTTLIDVAIEPLKRVLWENDILVEEHVMDFAVNWHTYIYIQMSKRDVQNKNAKYTILFEILDIKVLSFNSAKLTHMIFTNFEAL